MIQTIQQWWAQNKCEHDWRRVDHRLVTDDFLGMGWEAWTDRCRRCGRSRHGWRPA
jgi:hypothetical protein